MPSCPMLWQHRMVSLVQKHSTELGCSHPPHTSTGAWQNLALMLKKQPWVSPTQIYPLTWFTSLFFQCPVTQRQMEMSLQLFMPTPVEYQAPRNRSCSSRAFSVTPGGPEVLWYTGQSQQSAGHNFVRQGTEPWLWQVLFHEAKPGSHVSHNGPERRRESGQGATGQRVCVSEH